MDIKQIDTDEYFIANNLFQYFSKLDLFSRELE